MFNIGIIVGCLLYPVLGVTSLGVGVLLGGLGQILVQVPALLSKDVREGYGIRYEPTLGLKDPAVRKVGRVTPNILADVSITKLGSVVDIVLAMPLAAGMVSALNWAMVVFHLPFGLLSQSINTVVLKELSDRQALQKKESVGRLLVSGIGWNAFLLLPISALLIILARPLVEVLFGFGKFDATNASNVALALACYAIGLVGWGLTSLTSRFFSARMEQNRNTLTSAMALVVNVGLSIALVQAGLGIAGLALGTSISFLLCALVRLKWLLHSMQQEGITVKTQEITRGLAHSVTIGNTGQKACNRGLPAIARLIR
jgi:putative peptidoglycan lipid II flippase